MLALQLERLKRCRLLDQIVVATSSNPEDQSIVELCKEINIDVFRGNLDNVLDRFYQAACIYAPDHIVRLNGDCPLADPGCIDDLIAFYLKSYCDYASNCRPPTLPDGLDAEIFSFNVLKTTWQNAKGPYELEHVVPFIIRHPERFKIVNLKYPTDLSHLRWTVDEADDFTLVKQIYGALYPKQPAFATKDIVGFLERNPSLKYMNIHHKRNSGAEKAIEVEKELKKGDPPSPN